MYIPVGTLLFLLLLTLSPTIVLIVLKKQKEQEERRWEINAEEAPDVDLYITYCRLSSNSVNYYHTTKDCPRLAREDYISCVDKYRDSKLVGQRKPCPKCCHRENGHVVPKDPFGSNY